MAIFRIFGLSVCIAACLFNSANLMAQKTDNTIVVGIETLPTSIIPMVLTGSQSGQVSAQVFAGLCRMTAKGELAPYLARSFQYTPDYKTVEIILRKNATFHDGAPITAEDVAFSIRTAQKLHAFRTAFEKLTGIDVKSAHGLTLNFSAPQPHFMRMMVPSLVPILPRHIYKTARTVKESRVESTLVGSGPFKPVFFSNEKIVLKKYSGFFLKDRPFLDGITFIFFEKEGELHYGLLEQEMDVSAFTWRYAPAQDLKKAPYLIHSTGGYTNIRPYFVLQFNLKVPPFDNPLVRKALSLAVNRNFLAAHGFSRPVSPMYGPMVASDPFYTLPKYDHGRDIQKANTLLDEAGFPRNAAGVRMRIVTETAPYVSKISAILGFLQHDFSRTIGVELVVSTPKSVVEWEKNIGSGKYDSTIDELFSWHDPIIGFHRLYASSNKDLKKVWSNTSGFSDSYIDRLLAKAAMESDTQKRKAVYAKIQEGIGSGYAALWLTDIPYSTIYNSRVKGMENLYLSTMSPMDNIRVSKP